MTCDLNVVGMKTDAFETAKEDIVKLTDKML